MKRRSYGESLAGDLLTWVSGEQSEEQKRIALILELIVKLRDLSVELETGPEQRFSWQGQTFNANGRLRPSIDPKIRERQSQLSTQLNHRLRRYKMSPWYYDALGGRLLFGWWSGIERSRDQDDPSEDVWFTEEDAIIRILQLAQEGLLARITRCDCGDWFYARTKLTKFCCTRCQQRFYKKSPEWRAKRRIYMKELRAKHKKTYFPAPKKKSSARRKVD
jgi:hypothetical protein